MEVPERCANSKTSTKSNLLKTYGKRIYCAIPGCPFKHREDNRFIHKFPVDSYQSQRWKERVLETYPDWVWNKKERPCICSDHFEEDDFANVMRFRMGFSKCLYLKKTAAPVFGEKGPQKRLDVSALRAERRKQLEEKGEKETDSEGDDIQPEVEIETAEDYVSDIPATQRSMLAQNSTQSLRGAMGPALLLSQSNTEQVIYVKKLPQTPSDASHFQSATETGVTSGSLLPATSSSTNLHPVALMRNESQPSVSSSGFIRSNSCQSAAKHPTIITVSKALLTDKTFPWQMHQVNNTNSSGNHNHKIRPVTIYRKFSRSNIIGVRNCPTSQNSYSTGTSVVSSALLHKSSGDAPYAYAGDICSTGSGETETSRKGGAVAIEQSSSGGQFQEILDKLHRASAYKEVDMGNVTVRLPGQKEIPRSVKVVRKSPYVRLTRLDKTGSSDSVSDRSGTWLKDPQDESVYRLTHGQSIQSSVREGPSIQPMSSFVTSNQDTPASTAAIRSASMRPVTSPMISDQNIPLSTPEIHSAHIDPISTATSVVSNPNTTASTSVLQSCHMADVKREPDIPEDASTSLTFSPSVQTANSIKQELLCEAMNTSEVDSGANCSNDADGKEMAIKVETVDEDMIGWESRDKRHEVTNDTNGNREDTFVSGEQIFSMGKAGKEQEGSKDSSVVTLSELGEGGVTREEIQMEADNSESTGEANTCNKSGGEVSDRDWNSKDNEVSENEATGDVAMTDGGNDVHTEVTQNLNRDKGKGVGNLQSSSEMPSENSGEGKDDKADDCDMEMTVEDVDAEETTSVNTEASRRMTPSQTTPATRTVELTHEMLSDEKLFFSIIRWSCKIVAAMGGNIRLRVLLPQMSSTKYNYTLNVTKDLLECRETLERELGKIRVFLLIKKKEAIVNLKFVDD